MRCLFDTYKTSKKLESSYYGIKINVARLDGGEGLFGNNSIASSVEDNIKCRKFIEKHFREGSKSDVLNFDFYKDYFSNENDENAFRHVHMVSLYLLGLWLQDAFWSQIEKSLSNIIMDKSWFDFSYTWFLTCLYHDTGSFIEKQIPDNLNEQMKQLSFWIGNENITYTIYNHTPCKENVHIPRFSEGLIKNYFYYRMDNGAKDHGIVSGYLLFSRLKENFLKKTQGQSLDSGGVYIDGLEWRKEHLDHFAYIADAIICHNLWTVSAQEKEKVDIYRKYGLNPLILSSKNEKLKFQDYPFQFMLCLLDTIEPVKRFKGELSAREVLENVDIIASSKNEIIIKWTDVIKLKKGYDEWRKSIDSLEDWMDVEVSSCQREADCCGLTISIR